MRLSWNEIRTRAAGFAREWADAAYEKGETQSFYNEFFEIFGKRRRDVARYEERVQRLDNTSGFIDLFWPGVLLVEQKSAGRDLTAAREQAGTYFDALPSPWGASSPGRTVSLTSRPYVVHSGLTPHTTAHHHRPWLYPMRTDQVPSLRRTRVLSPARR